MSAATSPWSPAAQPDPWLTAADIFDPPRDSDRETALEVSQDLKRLTREAWPILEPQTPFVHGWHIDCVAEHLMAVTAGELPRLIINVPPRTMKSLSSAVVWPAWEWLRNAHIRWVFASYAQELSIRDSLKCRRLIESRGGADEGTIFQRLGYQGVLRLLHDDPWSLTGDQNAKTKYETTESGMRLATSVGGIMTGEGGDRIVVDDPLNAKQARSDLERNAANVWWDETMTTRFNNSRAAAVIVMQRLHEDDLTGHLLEQGGWHHLCLPAEYEPSHPFTYPASTVLPERTYTVQDPVTGEPDQVVVPGGRELPGDPRTAEGELLDPVRLAPDKLAELLRGLGSYAYAGQMQQRPAPAEGGQFKRSWWRRWRPEQLPPQWQRVLCSWDMRFSKSQDQASSFVVGQVWGVNGADRYLLAQIRARLSFTESVRAVQALAAWRPDPRDIPVYAPPAAKLVERKANGEAVMDTLASKITGLIPIEPEGGKEVRAAAIEPTVEAGNVFVPDAEFIPCPAGFEPTPVEVFIDEFGVFPNGSHDDQVDAASQALNWLEHKNLVATSTAYRPDAQTQPTVQDGDLVLVGDHYQDQP